MPFSCTHPLEDRLPISAPPYLYALVQAFQGVDVQALFAGLQTGNDLLALNLSRSNGQSRQAAPEVLSEAWLLHLPTYTHTQKEL